jgi:hypothetical protein
VRRYKRLLENLICIESVLYASIEYKQLSESGCAATAYFPESSNYSKMIQTNRLDELKRVREINKMQAKLFLSLILMFVPAVSAINLPPQKKDRKKEFIGYRHKGVLYGEVLPNGVRDLGGGLLSNYNYGVSRFTKGRKYMLWLEKITSRDSKGFPTWEVKDVLMFEDLGKNQEFHFSLSSACTQNGKQNLDLIVLVESTPKKTLKVARAWRANVRKEQFEKVSEKGIVCVEDKP